VPRKPKARVEVLPGIPLTDAPLNEFAPDRPLTAAEVESATRQFKKKLIERALGAELTHHLGYAPGAPSRATPPITGTARARRPS